MKKKWFTAILAVVVLSLVLAGCAAGTEATRNNGTEDTARYGAQGTQSNAGAALAEATEVGAGYRGGNGGNAGAGYSDDCTPIYDETTGSTGLYTATDADKALSLTGYGSEGALDDASLTLADMLTYAIQDEYLARAEYELIMSEYGSVRPFTNIMKAEETHIDALLPLFTAYGIAAPADEGADRAVSVASLTEAYQAGVNAEINNIAMYETFLDQDLPDDVRTVFESLMHASENHLRAFQNQL